MPAKKSEVFNEKTLAEALARALKPLDQLAMANGSDSPNVKILSAINESKIIALDSQKTIGAKTKVIIARLNGPENKDIQSSVTQCKMDLTSLQYRAHPEKTPGVLNQETLKNALQLNKIDG